MSNRGLRAPQYLPVMRAIEYVHSMASLKAGSYNGRDARVVRREIEACGVSLFDAEVRRLAAVVPGAHCCAGDSDFTSWFMADFNVGSQWLVLSYGKWEDGQYYWNLQRNDDNVDGPDGIVDLKRSKLFGVVLRYVSDMLNS